MQFVDTNVLLYRISPDSAEARKRSIATQILKERDIALSAQVLQEFYVQATRPSRTGRLNHSQAAALVSGFGRFPSQQITVDLVSAAIASCARFQLSYWDAAIIEAARSLGCSEVLSEDLSAGRDYNGVVVINPFE